MKNKSYVEDISTVMPSIRLFKKVDALYYCDYISIEGINEQYLNINRPWMQNNRYIRLNKKNQAIKMC